MKITRTRLKITILIILIQSYIGVAALHLGYTEVVVLVLGGITGSGLYYKKVETNRPSKK